MDEFTPAQLNDLLVEAKTLKAAALRGQYSTLTIIKLVNEILRLRTLVEILEDKLGLPPNVVEPLPPIEFDKGDLPMDCGTNTEGEF